jgi:hypothetical protein
LQGTFPLKGVVFSFRRPWKKLKRVYDDKDVQEWIVRSSGLDWTIVRPGMLTNGPATDHYRVLTASKDWRFGVISRADVADFLVRLTSDRALIGTTPLLISEPEHRHKGAKNVKARETLMS